MWLGFFGSNIVTLMNSKLEVCLYRRSIELESTVSDLPAESILTVVNNYFKSKYFIIFIIVLALLI